MKRKIFMLVLLLFGTAALIGFRVYQMCYYIEPLNGFFYPEFNSSRIIFGICLAVLALAVVIIALLDDTYPGRPAERSVFLGAATIAYCVGCAMYTINSYSDIIRTRELINLFLAFLFTAFILYYAVCLFNGAKISPVTAIIPVVFCGYRLAMHFLDSFGLIKSSEVTLDIIMLCCCTVFWLLYGKYITKIKLKKIRKWVLIFGVLSVSLCFLTTVPTLILKYGMNNMKFRAYTDESFFDIISGIYILVALIVSFSKRSCYRKLYLHDMGVSDEVEEPAEIDIKL